jgi:hypothetical protein
MFDHSLLKDLIRVDVIIGEDPSGGKFHMMMKVNFCLPEKDNILSNPNCKHILLKRLN